MNSFIIIGGSPNQQAEKVTQILKTQFQFQLSITDLKPPTGNPDILIIGDSQPSIGIDEIRNIISFCSLKPYQAKFKVVLVKGAQSLTTEAQNALLKTLEEPPTHCLIFLTTNHPSRLLPTVLSRCQIIEVSQSEIDPVESNLSEYKHLLDDLLDLTLGKSLALAESHTADKQSAVRFCQSLILYLETGLKSDPDHSLSPQASARLIRQLQKTLGFLEANTQLRLTIDNLVISLRNAAKSG